MRDHSQNTKFKIRKPRPDETKTLITAAELTSIWKPGEAEMLLGNVLQNYHAQKLGDGHEVFVAEDINSEIVNGWTYFAPSANAPDVYDIWWIGVISSAQGQGLGKILIEAVEGKILSSHGRLIVVETSSQPELERARSFYARQGYSRCGEIPDFYGPGDNKITFAKILKVAGAKSE